MQAQAAVATAPNRVEFADVHVPEPGPEDVVIRVRHSWISPGTEGSFVRGERIAGDTPREESDPLPFPHVPGYQKGGVIEHIGSDVRGIEVGDEVFATISHIEGMFFPFAGHVSPAVTHASQVWKLSPGASLLGASGACLAQVGFNVASRAPIEKGDAAVVIGDGLVGQWAAQVLASHGARVLMAGRHDERLALAQKYLPAQSVLNTRQEKLLEAAREWAPHGVAAVADTAGSIETLEELCPLMKHGGHIVSAGFYGPNGRLDLQKLRDRELTLHAPSGWNRERITSTLELLASGAMEAERLITHRFPSSRCGEAFELILSRSEPFLGVVLDWTE
jgi:2-desacetyl-2-hydroxyethyl bacteriochlorophyllide A dehydrogenase